MEEKVFRIDAADGTVTPKSHAVSLRAKDSVAWEVQHGDGLVIFPENVGTPVLFKTGPEVSPQAVAQAKPIVPGIHEHWIRVWPKEGRGREVVVVAVLIIDP